MLLTRLSKAAGLLISIQQKHLLWNNQIMLQVVYFQRKRGAGPFEYTESIVYNIAQWIQMSIQGMHPSTNHPAIISILQSTQ